MTPPVLTVFPEDSITVVLGGGGREEGREGGREGGHCFVTSFGRRSHEEGEFHRPYSCADDFIHVCNNNRVQEMMTVLYCYIKLLVFKLILCGININRRGY